MRSEIKVEVNGDMPMRDGTVLRAEIFRPALSDQFPTVNKVTVCGNCAPMNRMQSRRQQAQAIHKNRDTRI